jgi:hypothetical protein
LPPHGLIITWKEAVDSDSVFAVVIFQVHITAVGRFMSNSFRIKRACPLFLARPFFDSYLAGKDYSNVTVLIISSCSPS